MRGVYERSVWYKTIGHTKQLQVSRAHEMVRISHLWMCFRIVMPPLTGLLLLQDLHHQRSALAEGAEGAEDHCFLLHCFLLHHDPVAVGVEDLSRGPAEEGGGLRLYQSRRRPPCPYHRPYHRHRPR
jgi:hypothetical protein